MHDRSGRLTTCVSCSVGTIGIGGRRFALLLPSHTTGRAVRHPAVRKVEVMSQVSLFPFGRSSCWAVRC